MSRHIHAELIMQYAQDAMETDKPWERWEYYTDVFGEWRPFREGGPSWSPNYLYRKKVSTININGHEIPEPLIVSPEVGSEYFSPSVMTPEIPIRCKWWGDIEDKARMSNGVVHLKSDAAIAHARALISFTKKD